MDDLEGAQAVPAASPDRNATPADEAKSKEGNTPNGLRSSPPAMAHMDAMDVDNEPPNGTVASVDEGTKSDSEAETIVLPGKDGHSPSKIRKRIKHEDQSEGEESKSEGGNRSPVACGTASRDLLSQPRSILGEKPGKLKSTVNSISTLGKRKRLKNSILKDDLAHQGNSSGLSSVPTSPVATARSSLSKPTASDSDSKSPSPRSLSGARKQAKSVDRVLARNKHYTSHSGDEEEGERLETRQRDKSRLSADTNSRKRTRSHSPPLRGHRRSVSSQVPSKNVYGPSHKKKKVPAPLQSTEYHSDESSESASSHPRSSRPSRKLTAPPTGDSTMSPVKLGPHKKHVNSSGQTLLARACLSNRLDHAIQRYTERPQDLNEPDHALNTPLHVASINGYTDVVKFLLEKNCTVDVTNDQKDTPLHDAIENGHVDVVKLLLDAGANPNKPNRHGDEPLDLVAEMAKGDDYDEEEASQIRLAITEAKKNTRDARRLSEDEQLETRTFHQKEGSRHSPSVAAHEPHPNRRVGTARSIKTSDHLLYQRLDVNELRKAAKEGDASATARVLEVNTNLKDTKSLLLATRGGHFDVVNILFAMGQYDPDPDPDDEQTTPILAAIGRESHLNIIELFLSQDNFNPTRLVKGQPYYEIAKKRAGPKWQEEEKLFKDAYETYEKSHKSSSGKLRSPKLQREADRDPRRLPRKDEQQNRLHKRANSSPKARDIESNKSHHHRSTSSVQAKDGSIQTKRGPGRPRKEESAPSIIVSDPENTPLGPPKVKPQKRSESDVGLVSENEASAASKPRRKLISGIERELEKQRRGSQASNTSNTSTKEKRGLVDSKGDKSDGRVSPNLQRPGKKAHNEHEPSEKHSLDKERSRPLKRDDSKDRLSSIRGESPMKRPRKSETPPRSGLQEVTTGYGAEGGSVKRRKIEGDASTDSRSENATSSSSDTRVPSAKNVSSHDTKERSGSDAKAKSSHSAKKQSGEGGKSNSNDPNSHSRSGKLSSHGASSTVDSHPKKHKSISTDHTDKEKEREKEREKENARILKHKEEEAAREAEVQREKVAAIEAEAKREAEAEAEARRVEEEARRVEEEARREAEIKREEEEEAARQKLVAEELERERIEKANKARLARDEAARQEELKRQQEEAEKKKLQEIKDAEAQARAMEEQRTLYLEQERQKREEQERRRAAVLEQQRAERARVEEEKRAKRLLKLPLLLRWFDIFEDTKNPEFANLFRWIDGYRYDTIRPDASGEANGREQWMLNIHVAMLLGEKDLSLTRYTAWERVSLSHDDKRAVWKLQNGQLTLRDPIFAPFREQAPKDPVNELVEHNKSLFLDMDLFFVKVSEFMFIVPSFPHLRSIEMLVNYRELDTSFRMPPPPPKWKQDPDIDPNQAFAPQPKIYINGQLLKQREIPMTKVSNEVPSDDRRVPRRELVPVYPNDPDYEELCRKQGLTHLLSGFQPSPVSASSPTMMQQNGVIHHQQANGITPPSSDRTKSVNGGSPHRGSLSEAEAQHNEVTDPSSSPNEEKASGSS